MTAVGRSVSVVATQTHRYPKISSRHLPWVEYRLPFGWRISQGRSEETGKTLRVWVGIKRVYARLYGPNSLFLKYRGVSQATRGTSFGRLSEAAGMLTPGHLLPYVLALRDNSRRVIRRDTVIGRNAFPLAVVTPFALRHCAMRAKEIQPSYKHALM